MLTIIVVEDEMLLLQETIDMLCELPNIRVEAAFASSVQALAAMNAGLRADAIFLDINMPEISGIDLAECIAENWPRTNIVFLTAYDEYAIKAFDIGAYDYILKPLRSARLKKTINDLLERRKKNTPRLPSATWQVNFFGRFCIMADAELLVWRGKSVEEVIAYLLVHSPQRFSKEELISQFWPELDYKSGKTNLQVVVSRFRQVLADCESIKIHSDKNWYWIETSGLLTDVQRFEELVAIGASISGLEKLELRKIYNDGYLAENGWMWAYERAAQLDVQYRQALGAE